MREVKFGLIGLGGMASVHIEQLLKIEGALLSAVCDSDPARVADWGSRYGVAESSRHAAYADLIADPNVDAVLSITPNHVHYEIIRLCLERGKPLMTEKPFTRTFAEAEALLELAKTLDTPCMVGFSYRYVPSFRLAREMIREGRIGKVRHVFIQYLQDWGSPLYDTPMNWRWDPAVSGTGVLGDLGSHMIDAARFLVGEPVEVSSVLRSLIQERPDPASGRTVHVDIDDFAAIIAVLEDGIPAVFQTSRNAFGCGNRLEVSIYGDTGSLHAAFESGDTLTWVHQNEERCQVREEIAVPQRYRLKQMQDWVDFARGNAREETATLRDGYLNQRAMEAVMRAHESKRTVAVADVGANPDAEEKSR